ncbi:MAG: HEAT repeat domain-containing protein, partial [bacterium]
MAKDPDGLEQATPGQDTETVIKDFVISLTQAFLRTGYYLPNHPESNGAKAGLYETFTALAARSGELTFYTWEEDEQNEILIEGAAPHELPISQVMTKRMADVYVTKFLEFLQRMGLTSISISTRISKEEFSHFIDLMSEQSLVDMNHKDTKERFEKSLAEHGIRNASFIFNEDFISTRRSIPWRVTLALSRLRKDLKLLPTLQTMESAKLEVVKRETLHYALKPLSNPEQVYAFLMNLDLASNPTLTEEACEEETLQFMAPELLYSVFPLYIRDISSNKKQVTQMLGPHKLPRILDKLSARFVQLDTSESMLLLQELYESGLMSMDDLPAHSREKISIIRLIKSFLEYREKYLEHLDSASSPAEYAKRASPLAMIVPYLIESDRFEETLAISELLVEHTETREKKQIAHQALTEIADSTALEEARKAFLRVAKENRIILGKFFTLMGAWSVPHLANIIRESDDVWRRKQAAEILLDMNSESAAFLAGLVDDDGLAEEALCTIIKVLGNIQDKTLVPLVVGTVVKRIDHENPQIRLDSLNILTLLAPRESFDHFEEKLKDPAHSVRKEAIRGLGLSGDQRAFESLKKKIDRAKETASDIDWDQASAAISSLGHLMDTNIQIKGNVQEYILELSRRSYDSGVVKRILKKSENFPP